MSHDIEIFGDGCAALSFAARASEVNGSVTLIKPNNAPPAKDHVWGFWSDPILQEAQKMAKQTWNKWAVITHDECAVLESETKPYNAFKRSDWTKHCQQLAELSGVKIIDERIGSNQATRYYLTLGHPSFQVDVFCNISAE